MGIAAADRGASMTDIALIIEITPTLPVGCAVIDEHGALRFVTAVTGEDAHAEYTLETPSSRRGHGDDIIDKSAVLLAEDCTFATSEQTAAAK